MECEEGWRTRDYVRAAIIGITILCSQTLLQVWYVMAPFEFHSTTMLGIAVGFGDLFDLVTALYLGRYPRRRLSTQVLLLCIGVVGCGLALVCIEFLHCKDVALLLGFCCVGISTCFQPVLMLCNVGNPHISVMNSHIFAVFKQLSWASTLVIGYWAYLSAGLVAIIFFSVAILVFLIALASCTKSLDPFQYSSLEDSVCSEDKYSSESDDNSSPYKSDCGSEHSETEPLIKRKSSIPSASEVVYKEVETSPLRCYLMCVVTGGFTYEVAAHSTALELLLEENWGFSEGNSILCYCITPCVAAALYPVVQYFLTSVLVLRHKTQMVGYLCVLSGLNGVLPLVPQGWVAVGLVVAINVGRTALVGFMAPTVERCTADKRRQARLLMVQNMAYNGTWALASFATGVLCSLSISWTFYSSGIATALLLLACLLVMP